MTFSNNTTYIKYECYHGYVMPLQFPVTYVQLRSEDSSATGAHNCKSVLIITSV